MKSRTSTDYFSNSTSSFVTKHWLSLDRGQHLLAVVNKVQPFIVAHHQYVWAAYQHPFYLTIQEHDDLF